MKCLKEPRWRFSFSAPLERHAHGRAQIHLVTVPVEESDFLNDLPIPRGGFGSIKVNATVGQTTWRTSVFPTGEQFLLLVSRKVISSEELAVGEDVPVRLEVVGI